MFGPGLVAWLTTLSAPVALAQAVWQPNQVSTRICYWQQLRAAVLHDTVYLDGGALYWEPRFADGSAGVPTFDNNLAGLIYTLNFSTPFNTTQNISAILGTLETGGGDTNSRAPNYLDGALLGNDSEFCLYGGMSAPSTGSSDPPGDSVLCYQAYQYGADKPRFRPGFIDRDLGENVTRYVAYGGAASAPSENLAWYFSGLRSPTWGKIYMPPYDGGGATFANTVSNRLITMDMANPVSVTFTNDTLPRNIPGRANPELVWVPVGFRGVLVALGGVVYPDWVNASNPRSANETASREQSPEFMSTIDIYDVESREWYRQKTTGGPGQLARGCAVVARAQDGSSFNIYYYGGYDGIHMTERYNDDVWVLSLPSFTWVKLTSSQVDGRAGHKCVSPYPDQMLVIGGYPSLQGYLPSCLRETIRVFNLSTGEWLDRYDPAVYANYTVPSAVVAKIGGSGTGGATATSPSPSWDATELASIFAKEYPTSKITTYYPYASNAPVDNTNPSVPTTPADKDEGGGVPSFLPPVLGVVLGLVFVTMVAVLILLWRRRRLLRKGGGAMSEAGTIDTNKNRIALWLRGQNNASPEVKAPTVATSSDYLPVNSTEPTDHSPGTNATPLSIAEMMDTGVQRPVELPADTARPAELQSSKPSPEAAVAMQASLNNHAYYQSTHQTGHANSSAYYTAPPVPQEESPILHRPDSDALGRAPATSSATTPTSAGTSPVTTGAPAQGASGRSNKVVSGISSLSERDRAHLRQISDTTVSSVTTAPVGPSGTTAAATTTANNANNLVTGSGGRETVVSNVSLLSSPGGGPPTVVESPAAVSPPTATAGPGEGGDYLGIRPPTGSQQQQGGPGPSSPSRRSVFSENLDSGTTGDTGGQRQGR
ncbi:hypothetical protein MYCTH_2309903 [Thermothelomyces thermophilus ATCC 42464]|uniref:Uncharacterized protein n=1 Tax=Thermothelomyces thermophilus (strain ATCC 42464 / BCRC 31852 / DSM 1799) TaxID=573729 RepID=G2QKU5_THET4|nr:uncharacterized protein MYCTH_2309903 [Thermothelomyces thermophilus ATCC 42464]AEO60577.1 hypothetical protein MYCTH_2309903 [Thermothelomyces thermophilus ATCC 42464]